MYSNSASLNLKGFQIFRKDIDRAGTRGICMFIRSGIQWSTQALDEISHPSLEIQGIRLDINGSPCLIVNIYRHPGTPTPYSQFERLLNLANKFPQAILMGDLNAHHAYWGNVYEDGAGRSLAKAIDNYNYAILSDCSPTMILPPGSRDSIIDLVIGSPTIAPLCSSRTLDDGWGSDHRPVVTSLNGVVNLHNKFAYKWPLSSRQLDFFQILCTKHPINFDSLQGSTGKEKYVNFVNLVKTHLEKVIPDKLFSPSSKPLKACKASPPWWNEACQEAVDSRRSASIILRRYPTRVNYDKYKEVSKSCAKTLKKQKAKGWRNYCNSFNFKTPTAEIWSLVKLFKRRNLQSTPPQTGTESLINAQIAAANKLCPPSCRHRVVAPAELVLPPRDGGPGSPAAGEASDADVMDADITLEEIHLALNNFRLTSAPGLDQFTFKIIKSLPEEYIETLTEVYNTLLREGEFPTQWSQSLTVLIPKPQSSGVRPISLLSCFLKILEKIMHERLKWVTENSCTIPDYQAGFRPRRSCMDNLVSLTSFVHSAFMKKECVACVFLDIQGAFDEVIPSILLQDLLVLGLPYKFRKFVENLISEREIFFVINGELIGPRWSYKGTPQGSILSPLLFNIYLRDIHRHVNNDVNILQYADDIALFCSSKRPSDAAESLQNSLDRIVSYLDERGLTLSPSKSQLMIFSRSQKSNSSEASINIKGRPVARVDSARFLGMWLDDRLSGRAHFEHLIIKGRRLADIISSLSGVWWGAHPSMLIHIYRSVYRSSIEYGAQLFQPRNNSNLVLKIKRLSYRCLRTALGLRVSTPINVLLFEAREPPLEARIAHSSLKYLYRIMSNLNNPVFRHLEMLKAIVRTRKDKVNILKRFPLFKWFIHIYSEKDLMYRSIVSAEFASSYQACKYTPKTDLSLTTIKKDDSNETALRRFSNRVESNFQNYTHLYTDGSKPDGRNDPSGVGSSVYVPNMGRSLKHRLPPIASIFTAEAWAILQAIGLAEDLKSLNTVIFSDSLSVLKAIASQKHKENCFIIHQIKHRLYRLEDAGFRITLCWVPAHKGITGNELADQAAKEAAISGDNPFLRLPYADYYAEANRVQKSKFEAYLEETSRVKGKEHASLYQQVRKVSPWFHRMPLKREEIVIINRLRSQHYNLNYSLHRKNLTQSPTCPCGDSRQDANHIIFYCQDYIHRSGKLRDFVKAKFPRASINIFPILKSPCPKICRLLLAYFKSCELAI